MTDIVERLRTWAEDDVRAIATDMQVMHLSVDSADVRRWGALMDEAAEEIIRLRAIFRLNMLRHAPEADASQQNIDALLYPHANRQ